MSYQNLDIVLKNVYTDLIHTRGQLEKLRTQIHQTLKQIRQLDQLVKEKRESYQLNRKSDLYYLNIKSMHIESIHSYSCKKCPDRFLSIDQMYNHQIACHPKCQICNNHYFQAQIQHVNYLCPDKLIRCETCSTQIQRKIIDNHIKICSFRKCFKCQTSIYVKSYAYHINICDFNLSKQTKVQKPNQKAAPLSPIKPQFQQISILPCSFIQQ